MEAELTWENEIRSAQKPSPRPHIYFHLSTPQAFDQHHEQAAKRTGSDSIFPPSFQPGGMSDQITHRRKREEARCTDGPKPELRPGGTAVLPYARKLDLKSLRKICTKRAGIESGVGIERNLPLIILPARKSPSLLGKCILQNWPHLGSTVSDNLTPCFVWRRGFYSLPFQ